MLKGKIQTIAYNDDVEGIDKDVFEEDYSEFIEDYDDDDDDVALTMRDHDI